MFFVLFVQISQLTSLWHPLTAVQTRYSWFSNMPLSLRSSYHPVAKRMNFWMKLNIHSCSNRKICSLLNSQDVTLELIWAWRAQSKHSQRMCSGCGAWRSVSDVHINRRVHDIACPENSYYPQQQDLSISLIEHFLWLKPLSRMFKSYSTCMYWISLSSYSCESVWC